eukprot:9474447-Pyramimonas_sp.AAC.1
MFCPAHSPYPPQGDSRRSGPSRAAVPTRDASREFLASFPLPPFQLPVPPPTTSRPPSIYLATPLLCVSPQEHP